jgi:peptide/nickel transport system substrate-binding protein
MRDQPVSRPGPIATVLLSLLASYAITDRLIAQAGAPDIVRLADLEREAAQAPPPIAALFRALATPSGQPDAQLALTKIEQFLKESTGNAEVPPLVALQAAEKALCAVLRFHASAHPSPLAGPNPLAEMANRLEARLRDVRRRQVRLLAEAARTDGDWTEALRRAEQLRETYPARKGVQAEVAGVCLRYAEHKLAAKDYRAVRGQLAQIEEPLLPRPEDRKRLHAMHEALRAAAEALVREANSQQDQAAALAKLGEALALWPEKQGLQDELLRRQNAYAILYVGVGDLPVNLSPATAWTDAETHALDLLFESLVQPRYDPKLGQFYRPGLAAGMPGLLPGGRRFRLTPGALWSDGQPVTSHDLRHTAQLLRDTGRAPEWADLLDVPRVESDLFHIDFPFRQLPLDPLARLTFRVLPQTFRGQPLLRADDPAFAKDPVGSGPFCYAGRKTEDGRTYAVFTANPRYPHAGLPHLREIRFFVSRDPVADFRHPTHPLHLLLNVPTDRIEALKAAQVCEVHTQENRRVYFLAVNHGVKPLGNQDVRRAIAHAIDRTKILNDRFRGSSVDIHWWQVTRRIRHPEYHRALNGPYPTPSWATSPRVADAFRARLDLARAHASQAGTKSVALTLKYPDDDPRVAQACQDIADQVAKLDTGPAVFLRLKLVPLPPRQLKQDVERHDYDLAYYHLDYADESYWLWPLFDTRPGALGPGGSNVLGYQNDAVLESLFRRAMRERDFARLQETTYEIHAHLYEHMPLIPLWQLDTHRAVHPDLAPVRLDPMRVFAGVEDWTLGRRKSD